MIRAVVFDFDGVIANSEPLHFRAYRAVLAGKGIDLTEASYYSRYLGFDDVGAFGAVAADAGVPLDDGEIGELVAAKAITLEALERETSVLFSGAREAITAMAAHWPIAIASGALKQEIRRVLERERLQTYFPIIVAAGDTPLSKPDPAPYALAVEQLARTVPGLRPSECVAIEDSLWGLQSARGAGLRTVAITHTYPADALRDAADIVVERMTQFTPELVRRIEA
ncbi:MAG: HAD family hydrolase [Vicinamibacterales bacterium]